MRTHPQEEQKKGGGENIRKNPNKELSQPVTSPTTPVETRQKNTRERLVRATKKPLPRTTAASDKRQRLEPNQSDKLYIIASALGARDLIQEHRLSGKSAALANGCFKILLAAETLLANTTSSFGASIRNQALQKGYLWTTSSLGKALENGPEQKSPLMLQLSKLSETVFIPNEPSTVSSTARDGIIELSNSLRDLQLEAVRSVLANQLVSRDLAALQEIHSLFNKSLRHLDSLIHQGGQQKQSAAEYSLQLQKACNQALQVLTALLITTPDKKQSAFWQKIDARICQIEAFL